MFSLYNKNAHDNLCSPLTFRCAFRHKDINVFYVHQENVHRILCLLFTFWPVFKNKSKNVVFEQRIRLTFSWCTRKTILLYAWKHVSKFNGQQRIRWTFFGVIVFFSRHWLLEVFKEWKQATTFSANIKKNVNRILCKPLTFRRVFKRKHITDINIKQICSSYSLLAINS